MPLLAHCLSELHPSNDASLTGQRTSAPTRSALSTTEVLRDLIALAEPEIGEVAVMVGLLAAWIARARRRATRIVTTT